MSDQVDQNWKITGLHLYLLQAKLQALFLTTYLDKAVVPPVLRSPIPPFYPPSDGYKPPEDPLVGVVRQIEATRQAVARHPDLGFVGSAYTYLQEWLPRVAQALVREGAVHSIGLGRMMLSYPRMPRDILGDRALERGLVCRTFSDCTTAPRNGLVSGCYPIDEHYKRRPEATRLAAIKKGQA